MRHPFVCRPLGRNLLAATLVGAAFAAASFPAKADGLTAAEILDQFNGVVTGVFSTTSDVEGRLVAGTIKNTNSATFYTKPNALDGASTFQAVNGVTIQSCPSCNVNSGGSVDFVNSSKGSFNFNAGGGHPKGSLVQNAPAYAMSDFTTPLNALETQLAALTPNSTVNASDPNKFTFTISPMNGLAVFDVPVSELSLAKNIIFKNLSKSDTIIINVTSATPDWSYTQTGNFNAPSTTFSDQTIWNFVGATTLSFTSWHGAVLAGDASVTNSSPIEGMLYAASFTGGGELHDRPFTGSLPTPVPEPSTWAMMGLGFLGLALMGRRLRRRSAVA